jgi:K+-sensing histidine kinase KdpD
MVLNITTIALACSKTQNFDSLIQLGKQMAQKFNATLHVFLFENTKIDLTQKLEGVKFNIELCENATAKNLSEKLNIIKPDFLILSNKNKDNSDGLFSLSETCKIIEHAEKPVLTIPGNFKFENFDSIVIPIDTSFETRQKGPATIIMAQKFNSLVKIVGVSTDKSKDSEFTVTNYSRQVRNKMAENSVDSEIELRLGGNITEQTIEYANEVKASLVIIMTEQEINYKAFFNGKFSEQFIKLANFPVLSVNTLDLIVSEARL